MRQASRPCRVARPPQVFAGRRPASLLAGACAAALVAIGAGCALMPAAGPGAQAQLMPRSGSAVSGTVGFTQRGDKLVMTGEVRGLRPNAEHGFHVHERGDCSAPDASSAGGHFNPDAKPHGRAGQGQHHAGDVPNLKADANGVARVDVELSWLSLAGATNGVIGRSLVVHRDPDDYRSQPAGNSGPRVACGLIVAAN